MSSPAGRTRSFTESEFQDLLASRDPEDCAMRRERIFQLANALLEGTRLILPKALRDRSDGSLALDATMLELDGKAGNHSSKNLVGDRRTANPDGGWYGREGDHAGLSKADAAYFNETTPGKKSKGSSTKEMKWGIEVEVARQVPNYGQDVPTFPTLNVGWSAHIPGEIQGEALRIADSLIGRGHKSGFFIVDRAYPNGKVQEYAIPLRKRGFKHVFNYKRNEIGVGALDPRGFVQISGSWYLDTVPTVLREADGVVYDAKKKWFAINRAHIKAANPTPDNTRDFDIAKKAYIDALDLYARQFHRREQSRLKPKGQMDENGDRRYLIPTESPDYAKWKAKRGSHQSLSVEMKLPTAEQFANDPNAGGLKREQYLTWGSTEWTHMSGKRNSIEALNANVKRTQYEGIGDASLRAVRGNTFTYLISALALVTENLRTMISYFKKQLAVKPLTVQNKKAASTFWQAERHQPRDPRDRTARLTHQAAPTNSTCTTRTIRRA